MQEVSDKAGEEILKAISNLEKAIELMPDGMMKLHITRTYQKLYAIANELKLFDLRINKKAKKRAKKDD